MNQMSLLLFNPSVLNSGATRSCKTTANNATQWPLGSKLSKYKRNPNNKLEVIPITLTIYAEIAFLERADSEILLESNFLKHIESNLPDE